MIDLSYSLPVESKFKIYISALTQLNIDDHNRVPTTDGRLIRRIVRDARTQRSFGKGHHCHVGFRAPGRGTEHFPYQESADVMFNSALIYELAVFKLYAEPSVVFYRQGLAGIQRGKAAAQVSGLFSGVSAANHAPQFDCARIYRRRLL